MENQEIDWSGAEFPELEHLELSPLAQKCFNQFRGSCWIWFDNRLPNGGKELLEHNLVLKEKGERMESLVLSEKGSELHMFQNP